MIVVHTSTSILPPAKSTMACSSWFSGIWPCAMPMVASGTSIWT